MFLSEPGCSGSWVVRGDTLIGMVVAIYKDEPFAQIITAAKLVSDIKASVSFDIDVSLPVNPGLPRGDTDETRRDLFESPQTLVDSGSFKNFLKRTTDTTDTTGSTRKPRKFKKPSLRHFLAAAHTRILDKKMSRERVVPPNTVSIPQCMTTSSPASDWPCRDISEPIQTLPFVTSRYS